MSEALHNHLRKLNIPNAFLQRQVVAAVFQSLQKDTHATVNAIRDVVTTCLTHSSEAVVEETVHRLLTLTASRKDVLEDATDMYLAALVSVQPCCAALLSRGLVDLFYRINNGAAGGKPPESKVLGGHSHPFVSAWFSNPAAPTHLISALSSHMAHMAHVADTSASPADRHKLVETFKLAEPFIVYVLVVGPNKGSLEAADWQLAGTSLCQTLVRWGFSSPTLAHSILQLLLYCLYCCKVSSHSSGQILLPCLPLIMDLLELVVFGDDEEGDISMQGQTVHSHSQGKQSGARDSAGSSANRNQAKSTSHGKISSIIQSEGSSTVQSKASSTVHSNASSTVHSKASSTVHSKASNTSNTIDAVHSLESVKAYPSESRQLACHDDRWTACDYVCEFAQVLVLLCKQLVANQCPITPVLSCLLTLRKLPDGPRAVAQQLLPLAELAADSTSEEFALLSALLLTGITQLSNPAQESNTPQQQPQAQLTKDHVWQIQGPDVGHVLNMLLFPVLPQLTLSTNPRNKVWASHLLAALERHYRASLLTQPSAQEGSGSAAIAQHDMSRCVSSWGARGCEAGVLGMDELVMWVARVVGVGPGSGVGMLQGSEPDWMTKWAGAAIEWLHSLQLCLYFSRSKPSSPPSDTKTPSTYTCMILTALLSHSSPVVQISAASTLRQLLLLQPLLGLQFTPIVLYCLNSTPAEPLRALSPDQGRRGRPNEHDGAAVGVLKAIRHQALLHVLPSMAADTNMSSYAQRALQPLTSASSPPGVYAGGLRLVVDMWALTGKGWNRVEDVLNGYADPRHKLPPLRLRLARAGLVLQVCLADTAKGLQLIPAIQQCATDPDPAVASIGLEALDVLCRDDTLDFYKAFSVLHKWHPRLPEVPLLAGKWVEIMGRGALDAEAYPDKAMAIIELLWSAMDHPSEEVRGAAYSALSAYPLDLLEKLEVAAELEDYVAPCLTEQSASAQPAAERLAGLALAHEHQHRRRFLLLNKSTVDTAGGTDSKELSLLTYRLSHNLPRQLCRPPRQTDLPSTTHPAALLLLSQTPDTPSTAQRPSQPTKTPTHDPKSAGKGPATHAGLTNQSTGSSTAQHTTLSPEMKDVLLLTLRGMQWNDWTHPWAAIHAWEVFFKRWQRRSGGMSVGEVGAVVDVVMDVWQKGDAAEEANCHLAAAGLCSSLMQGPSSSPHHSTALTLLDKVCDSLPEGRSSTVQRAAIGAAAHITCSLEPCDSSVWGGTLQLLSQHFGQGERFHPECAAAGADAAAFICCQLLKKQEEGAFAEMDAVTAASATVLSMLLALLNLLWPHHSASLMDLVAQLPADWNASLPEFKAEFLETLLLNEEGQHAVVPYVVKAASILLVQMCRTTKASAWGVQTFMGVLKEEVRSVLQVAQTSDTAPEKPCPAPLSAQTVAAATAALQALPILLLAGWSDQRLTDDDMDTEVQAYRTILSSGAVDNKVVGAAAWGLGQVLCSMVQDASTPSAAATAAIHQLTALITSKRSKQAHSSAQLCGAAVALSLLLGATPPWPTGLLLSSTPRGVLVATVSTGAARAALKALEDAALLERDPRVTGVAAWALADVCYAATQLQATASGGQSGTTSSGPELKPLSAYPANGAVRPLVEAVLDPQKRSELGPGTVASVLRCLATCPQLPSANWSGLTRSLMRGVKPGEGTGAEQSLLLAVARFLLAHVRIPQFGLAAVLEESLTPTRFRGLPLAVQLLLSEEIGSIAAHLTPGRATVVLQSLGTLVKETQPADRSQVARALWLGMGRAAGAAEKPSHVLAAIQRGVAALLLELPVPVQLLPGHILQLAAAVRAKGDLVQPAALHPEAAYQVPVPFMHPYAALLDQYAAAAFALSQLDVPWVRTLLDTRNASSVEAAAVASFVFSLLVLSGHCSSKELVGCQSWLMNLKLAHEGQSCVEAAMVAVAMGLSTAEPRGQVQSLIDTITACKGSANPDVGLVLAACMASSFQFQVNHTTVGDVCCTLISPPAAVMALPYTLVALVQGNAVWAAQADSVSHAAMELLGSDKCKHDLKMQVLHALVAIRQHLSHSAWSRVLEKHLLWK